MNKSELNIVWLKRDLRTLDHEALQKAEEEKIPFLIIYIFDSELLNHSDSSNRHLRFIYDSLLDMG